MEHRIDDVQPHGIAWRRGARPGDVLLSINGEQIIDHIDYQALSVRQKVDLLIRTGSGEEKNVRIIKAKGAPLGLSLSDTACVSPSTCHNKCKGPAPAITNAFSASSTRCPPACGIPSM